jgi:hypothetical protein
LGSILAILAIFHFPICIFPVFFNISHIPSPSSISRLSLVLFFFPFSFLLLVPFFVLSLLPSPWVLLEFISFFFISFYFPYLLVLAVSCVGPNWIDLHPAAFPCVTALCWRRPCDYSIIRSTTLTPPLSITRTSHPCLA